MLDKQNLGLKIVSTCIFLPISFNICLGAKKNGLIETVLLSTHIEYMFWLRNKIFFFFSVHLYYTMRVILFLSINTT